MPTNPKNQFVISIVLLLAGLMLLDLMSVVAKILRVDHPPALVSTARNIFAVIPLCFFIYFENRRWLRFAEFKIQQWRLALVRGLMVALAQFFLYGALGHLALATTITIAYASPFFITVLSIFWLKERVGHWRWGAVLGGLVGVIWVISPTSDIFTWWAVAPLVAGFLYANTLVLARRFEPSTSNAVINLYSLIGAVLSSLLLLGVSGFFASGVAVQPSIDLVTLALAALMGTLGGCGVYCLTLAFRRGEASMLASFEYFGLISALFLGWLVFDEWPIERLFPGILLIAGAGLLIVFRGRVQKA